MNTTALNEHRQKLLSAYPDELYGVYKIKNYSKDIIELVLEKDAFAVYENNLKKLEYLDSLIKFKDLRDVRDNSKDNFFDRELLVSNGIFEYLCEGVKKKVVKLLRDSSNIDSKLYTSTTAGRNHGENLYEEMMREYYEEAPFLGKNKLGELVLCVSSEVPDGYNHTINAVKNFLNNKYDLYGDTPDELFYKNNFEKKFGFSYEQLGDYLNEIISKQRFSFYNTYTHFPLELHSNITTIILGENQIEAYVFFDKNANTIEYRQFREILSFPKNFSLLTDSPSRLYLESRFQDPSWYVIGEGDTQFVPTVNDILKNFQN